MDSRLTDLESTVAFQDKTIGDLSEVVCDLRKDVDALQHQIKELAERLEDQSREPEGDLPAVEIPPHY